MKTVVIDPGHGGNDSGAVGNNAVEKDIVLKVAHGLSRFLADYDVRTVLTRTGDKFLSLRERVALCNSTGSSSGRLFVSIHCNAASREQAKGYEIFTTPGKTDSDKAADLAMREYADRFPDRKQRADLADGDLDKEANFAVLKCKGPAILVELGFVTNREEADWLLREHTQAAQADAIGRAIVTFLDLEKRLKQNPDPINKPKPAPDPSPLPEILKLQDAMGKIQVQLAVMSGELAKMKARTL